MTCSNTIIDYIFIADFQDIDTSKFIHIDFDSIHAFRFEDHISLDAPVSKLEVHQGSIYGIPSIAPCEYLFRYYKLIKEYVRLKNVPVKIYHLPYREIANLS